jgi:hypothetical protein
MTTETVGISAEIAIADIFKVSVSADYKKRGDKETINKIKKVVRKVFSQHNIPNPQRFVAEKQNPIDFELVDGKTLSVKTNQKKLGKVAPQNVGQCTSETYFEKFKSLTTRKPKRYEDKVKLFKEISVSKIDKVFEIYWKNLFHCDYYIHFYNVCSGNLSYAVFEKPKVPQIKKGNFSFTHIEKNKDWNEGTTLRYSGITIGEFQAHQSKDCFKFRFDISGIKKAFSL